MSHNIKLCSINRNFYVLNSSTDACANAIACDGLDLIKWYCRVGHMGQDKMIFLAAKAYLCLPAKASLPTCERRLAGKAKAV